MFLTRRALLGVSAAAAMVAAAVPLAGGTASAHGAPVVRRVEPEADVSHHGHVVLWGDTLTVRMHSQNRGPSDVSDATVRLRVSVPLAGGQELPGGCLQEDPQTVLCRTGPLRADGRQQHRIALGLRLAGLPDEVVVRVGTAYSGGTTDRDAGNNEHEVLALATGDPYVF
ncbi:hypothetical protein [Streptomyces sp. NPDC091040]|uniref:hypothetical protein n=1 Tax=Streptomyces sp. NPDC091040 TaxID=3365972 RepID=UPI003810671D